MYNEVPAADLNLGWGLMGNKSADRRAPSTIKKYPTLKQVEAASREQLCRWHRFLRSPMTANEVEVNRRIFARWQEVGGFTPGISKRLGYG